MKENKDGTHIRELLLATFTPRFFKELYKHGLIKMNNCNYKYNLPSVSKCCHKYYETERENRKIWVHLPLYEKDNCPVVHPELLSAAKKKADKVCLWCGGKLKNDNDSFCSVYCVSMWNREWD